MDPEGAPLRPGAAFAALLFLGLTGLLLVLDLRRPGRFLWTLTRPQWRSWLTRGAYAITAYGLLLTVLLGLGLRGGTPSPPLVGVTAFLAALTAVYTAFLFGQAKGRDLWQSPLLAPHLLVQALVAGATVFAPAWLAWLLPVNGLLLASEVFGRHPTEDGRRAAELIQGAPLFTSGVLAMGHLLPLALLWTAPQLNLLASLLALVGLLAWEHLHVQAPQRMPLA